MDNRKSSYHQITVFSLFFFLNGKKIPVDPGFEPENQKWNPESVLLVQQCSMKSTVLQDSWTPFWRKPRAQLQSIILLRAYQFHIFDLNIPAYSDRRTAQCTFHRSNTRQDSVSFRIEIQ